jgi:hypothetical protein
MKIFENTFPAYKDLQILVILFTSYITPHTTLSNELCLKLLLGFCNTEERCELSISLVVIYTFLEVTPVRMYARIPVKLRPAGFGDRCSDTTGQRAVGYSYNITKS